MSVWSRRDLLKWSAGASASAVLARLHAQQNLLTKPIPSSGERVPVIGLGSSATFSQVARSADVEALSEVMKTFVGHGGKIFDTAPSYGASEEVAGKIAQDPSLAGRIFWATKVNVARGGGNADPRAAKEQIEGSFKKLGAKTIDLIQVHNLGDVPTQLGILKELKGSGRVRYIGVTTTSERDYGDLAGVMKSEPLDFIGVNYAIDDREVEKSILPLARDRKIAVLAYVPFGRTRLFRRVEGKSLPDWAAEFDAESWAQFFLKFVVSHPSITAATPATSQAKNMLDNIGGGIGRLPDEPMRKRMAEFVDALPSA